MADIIDLTAYVERAARAKKSTFEREKFSTWAIDHLDDVAKRFGCDMSDAATLKGFRVGAQWALDLQERHEKDVIAALRPRWETMGRTNAPK